MNKPYMILVLLIVMSVFCNGSQFQDNLTNVKNIYSPVGKRDPFKRIVEKDYMRMVASFKADERFTIEQLSLRAILHDQKGPVAMFEDPEGGILIVKEGDTIGRQKAIVSKILRKDVIVTEHTTNYLGIEGLLERVISLPKEDYSGVVKHEFLKSGDEVRDENIKENP